MFRKLVEIYKLKLSNDHTDDYKGNVGYSIKQANIWKKDWLKNLSIKAWTMFGSSSIEEFDWYEHKEGGKVSWKPLGRLPRWTRQSDVDAYKFTKKANRYLIYQEKRIIEAVEAKKYSKATLIWLILLKNSFSYQVCLFNKVMPQWHYMLNKIEARSLITKVVNKCRVMDLALNLKRFYILKADGIRWRPIGAPDYPSRVISRSLNDLIYVLWEDKFNKNQHGFRKNRGAFTAIIEIVKKLKNSPKIVYEFDLKSFFNTVRPMWVYRALLARSPILAEMVYKMIMLINYKLPNERRVRQEIMYSDKYVWMILLQPIVLVILIWKFMVIGYLIWGVYLAMVLEIGFHLKEFNDKELNIRYMPYLKSLKSIDESKFNIIKPERELRTKVIGLDEKNQPVIHTEPMEIMSKKGPITIQAPYILREGLPQGLSISPVLATLTMEMFKNPKELVLYADDGVYIGDDWTKFLKWKQDMSLIGAELAENKSRVVKRRFKFLGCQIDMEKEVIEYKNKIISWWDPEMESKLIRLYVDNPYQKNEKGWNWDVRPNSWTSQNYKDYVDLWNMPIFDWFCIWYKSVIWGLPHKGYRMFKDNTIIDILEASSFAVNELVKSKGELNLVAIRPLCPVFRGKLSNFCMNKSCYYEEIYENSLRSYIRKQLPEWKNVMENYWDH